MHVVVRGRVQGVGFRYGIASRARSFGLGGCVRNLPDGTVEAFVEGPRDRVASLVDWCRRGPAGARVDGVEATEEAPLGETEFAQRPAG